MNKRIFFAVFFTFLFLLSGAGCTYASENPYQDVVTNSLHAIDCPQSLNEAAPFQGIPFSPDGFMQAVGDDVTQLDQVLEANGLDTRLLPSLSTMQAKRFTFCSVPVSSALCNVTVIRYGCAPSYLAVVFVQAKGEWVLTDILPDVESVEAVEALTHTWLKIKTSAFADNVQIERLYSLSTRKHEVCYASRDASPAYDAGIDDVVLLSAYSMISEYSTVEGTESVYAAELYVVKDTSLCTMAADAVLERGASTQIDVYAYDYEKDCFVYLQTNRCEGVGAATVHHILRKDLLLSGAPILKQSM